MRVAVPAGILIAAILVGAPMGARAQNYPWCSNFHDGAGTNCGFSTYEQCMATARGSGGYCDKNSLYVAPHSAISSTNAKRQHKVPRSRQ